VRKGRKWGLKEGRRKGELEGGKERKEGVSE
jgi:hypothetical protein